MTDVAPWIAGGAAFVLLVVTVLLAVRRRRRAAMDPVDRARAELDRLYQTDPAAARLLGRRHDEELMAVAAARRARVPADPAEAQRYYDECLAAARRCDLTLRYLARQVRRGKAEAAEVAEARDAATRFRAEAEWARGFLS